MAKLEITLKKSFIGRTKKQIDTAKALGLRKPNQTVVKENNDAIKGMIRRIDFMLDVKEAN
ncbi:MAG: 50S ribosomal protein L30 [Peptoniphilaceae bacterium]|nr:50S ribosomal protein L30 [Peptoniphilaceae bacterium]MDD7382925.1 50S ribosomal protein L30 [Peptoniphilaceae bacterium]MDY3737676.1 50S ribosomal protein L30 [Peptoniphilaceae bacterium]